MKSLLRCTCVFVVLLMLFGCVNRKVNTKVEETIFEKNDLFVFDLEKSFEDNPGTTTINGLAEDISYIPLETHKDALLGDNNVMFKIDGNIYISGMASPIYQFDSLGRYVKKVVNLGRGPGEVVMPLVWYGNAILCRINVIGISQDMVLVSTRSGEKSTIKINHSQGYNRVPLNDSTFVASGIVLTGRKNPYLLFTDDSGNFVHSIERDDQLLNYKISMPPGEIIPPFEDYWLAPVYDGDAIFHDIFNDTLYRVRSRNEITPHLVFGRGKLSPDPNANDSGSQRRWIFFDYVKESADYVFLKYYFDGKKFNDVWSKRDGSLKIRLASERVMSKSTILVPFVLPDGTVIDLSIVYAEGNNIYGELGALDACKFLPGVKEDDNPVIVIAKLKE